MITLEYHFRSVLKSSEKGDIQLVVGDDGKLYVRRYREISKELFTRVKSVSCPFVERLTEQSADENGAYIISEYIEGTPASDRTFTEKEAVNALLELCSAISALHKSGIIHRDIKPANLICGADGQIRLIDFDSARLEKTYQSHDTEMLGTAGFAPPEQYGFTQTDSRSDIYSFGVTMREILGDSAEKPKFRRIINRCTQFDPERRYSDISAVRRAVKRASRPNLAPFAVAGVIIAAGMVLFLRKEPPPAPLGIVRLSETIETESTIESAITAETEVHTTDTTEDPPTTESTEVLATAELTQEPPMETVEFPTTEPIQEQTTETPYIITTEQTEKLPEITEPTGEVTTEATLPAAQTTESTTEYISVPAEEPEPERTPNIISDSINPNKMPFETVQDDDGLYEDIFDYVFYDDPAVHGTWRAYKVLPGNTDIGSITGDDIFNADYKNGMVYEFISVYPDGTLAFYQPRPEHIEPTNVWTNGYYISSLSEGGLVCRMRAFTIENGRRYLALEQRSLSVSDDESLHRYIIYFKVDT